MLLLMLLLRFACRFVACVCNFNAFLFSAKIPPAPPRVRTLRVVTLPPRHVCGPALLLSINFRSTALFALPTISSMRHRRAPPKPRSKLDLWAFRFLTQAINSMDLKAIGSAELVQDIEVVTQLFSPGAPILLEVKVRASLGVFCRSCAGQLRGFFG